MTSESGNISCFSEGFIDILEDAGTSEGGWIQWYCSLEDHSFLCEIPEDYIRSKFNLFGLKSQFKNFN